LNADRFEHAVQSAFAFLEDDFGMTVKLESNAERRRHWWGRYVTYVNDRMFLRVELDNRDRAFNILLGPLVDGEIPPYPIFLERDDEPLTWFPLWAILQSRGVEDPPFSFAEDEQLDAELSAWAAALRDHAAAALAGDFDELREPVRRVKNKEAAARLEGDERLFGPGT
jgi:hypothetical protein